MGAGKLTIDVGAIVSNWRNLDQKSTASTQTAAVIKANAYGLGAPTVGPALAKAGARTFFVAVPEEGVILRNALGPGPEIYVFGGYMSADQSMFRGADLIPLLNSPEQVRAYIQDMDGNRFGLQLDTGMNRLGIESSELAEVKSEIDARAPTLVMSHLACADEPDHAMNTTQHTNFVQMTKAFPDIPKSLSATGGILLGKDFHFDLVRPGVGLYGGLPFSDASPVVTLTVPVIQTRRVEVGETVGYGNTWTATTPRLIATIAAGYADGLARALGPGMEVFDGETACPVVGRVSMDLITVDVTDLPEPPKVLTVLGQNQTVDKLADASGTIGYEILTSLGHRYARQYV